MVLLAFLIAASVARAGQTLVPAWLLDGLEEQARTAPTADGLLDLAELWSRIAEDETQKALAAHVAAYEACFNALRDDCDTLTVEDAAARQAWSRAAARYQQFLRSYPDDPRLEQAIYGLGWAWQQKGEAALASAAFTWVGAASVPGDARRQDAWLLAGEHAFETWELEQATLAFQQAAEEGGMLAPWARRRLGWSYYRQGELALAIVAMKDAIWMDDPQGSVREEALQDLIRFYEEAGELDVLLSGERLSRSGQTRALFERLAQGSVERGQYDIAIQHWRRLIAEAPDHPDVPRLQASIIEAYLLRGAWSYALAEVERAERRLPADPPAALQHAREHTLREAGQALQAAGRLDEALQVYDHYLDAGFPEYAYEVAFWRAQVLEGLGHRAEARASYQQLAADHPNARYARLAAEGARRLAK